MRRLFLASILLTALSGCVDEGSVSNGEVDELGLDDPCRPLDVAGCSQVPACTWLDRGVDTCVASFGLLDEGDVDATYLILPERMVTLEDLELEPLTDSELTVARANAEAIYHAVMSENGLLDDDAIPRHSSSYCGHGSSGTLNKTIYVTYAQVCGSPGCHYHKYDHYGLNWIGALSYIHSEWRACG